MQSNSWWVLRKNWHCHSHYLEPNLSICWSIVGWLLAVCWYSKTCWLIITSTVLSKIVDRLSTDRLPSPVPYLHCIAWFPYVPQSSQNNNVHKIGTIIWKQYLDDLDDLNHLGRTEFYADDLDDWVEFEVIIQKNYLMTEKIVAIEGYPRNRHPYF